MSDLSGYNFSRRSAIKFSAALTLLGISGCCSLLFKSNPEPKILAEVPKNLPPIFKPPPFKNTREFATVIDVHAHFFNAKDVPVSGYLGGPVAHQKGGVVGRLLKILAKHAEWITQSAPSAEDEFNKLIALSSNKDISSIDSVARTRFLDLTREEHLNAISEQFFDRLKNDKEFVAEFNSAVAVQRIKSTRVGLSGPADFNEKSLFKAMEINLEKDRKRSKSLPEENDEYPEGVLAFVGYMMSYRWMNLSAYQKAYTTDDSAFGVTQVLGVLVDFNHWLCPPARTAQIDQIKLHQLLSELSGGYMRPVVAFNPWHSKNDKAEKSLELVKDALDNRGFVGVKIYPANGFRPYGNEELKVPILTGPSGKSLDETMEQLWIECQKRQVPVMAHTGESMGSNDALNKMAEPAGWKALINKFKDTPVRVNLGHFGGEKLVNKWSEEFTQLMNDPAGKFIYADLGYWDSKECLEDSDGCDLKSKLSVLASGSTHLKERLMFGTDWLMLSQVDAWSRYPFIIKNSLPENLDQKLFFGENALNCFPKLRLNLQGEK